MDTLMLLLLWAMLLHIPLMLLLLLHPTLLLHILLLLHIQLLLNMLLSLNILLILCLLLHFLLHLLLLQGDQRELRKSMTLLFRLRGSVGTKTYGKISLRSGHFDIWLLKYPKKLFSSKLRYVINCQIFTYR